MSTDAEGLSNLGITYQVNKQYEEAIKCNKIAVELEPQNAEYQQRLGISYHANKQYKEAIDAKKKAVELEPKNAEYLDSLGISYFINKQYEEAIKFMKNAVGIEPDNAKYLDNLSTIYHTIEQYEEAIEFTKRAVEQEPENASYLNSLSLSYHVDGQYKEAIVASKKAVELEPNNAEYYEGLSASYHANGQYEEAIVASKKAVELEPNNAEYYEGLSASYHANGQYEEAIVVSKKAVELEPNNAEYLDSLSISLRANGQHTEAINALKKAVELEPNKAAYRVGLSKSYLKNRQFEKAIAAAKKVLELEPNNAEYHDSLSESYQLNGEYEKAIEAAKKAVELESNNAHYHHSLGASYYANGQNEEAIKEYETAIALQPTNNQYYDDLALVYLRLSNGKKALEVLDNAIEIDKAKTDNRKAMLYYNYVFLDYVYTGNINNSRTYLEEGKKAYLNNPRKQSINKFLNIFSGSNLFKNVNNSKIISTLSERIELIRIFAEIHSDVLGDTQYYFLSKIVSTFRDYPKIQSNLIGIHLSMKQIMKQCAISIPEGAELAHYSRLENLNYLVKKSGDPAFLRLNNAAYMNDPSEGLVFISTLKECHGCDGSLLNKVYDRFVNEDTNMQASDVYLFSLTLLVDELPMWAQYGDKGHGCCLVIRNDFFDSVNEDIQHDIIGNRENGHTYVNPYIPYRVIYVKSIDNEIQLSMANVTGDDDSQSIDQIKVELDNIVKYIQAASNICQSNENLENSLIEHLRESIDQIRYLFKTTVYEYEEELRLIRYEPINSNEIQLNNASSPVPTLYVERTGENLRYSKIILGPKVEEANRIVPYLKYVDSSLEVKKSNVPFR